jgi:hypothetical protein
MAVKQYELSEPRVGRSHHCCRERPAIAPPRKVGPNNRKTLNSGSFNGLTSMARTCR